VTTTWVLRTTVETTHTIIIIITISSSSTDSIRRREAGQAAPLPLAGQHHMPAVVGQARSDPMSPHPASTVASANAMAAAAAEVVGTIRILITTTTITTVPSIRAHPQLDIPPHTPA